jgi:hypothetical protein
MKIDFGLPITDLDGKPVEDDGKPVTLGAISIAALLNGLDDDSGRPERLNAEAKVRQAVLASAIYTASDPINIKVDDVSLLKERIGRLCGPLVVMRAWTILDPK